MRAVVTPEWQWRGSGARRARFLIVRAVLVVSEEDLFTTRL